MVFASKVLPIATIGAIAEASSFIASSIPTRHSLFNSVRIVDPALNLKARGFANSGGTIERNAPRVHMMQSAYGIKGTIDISIRSKPLVGPIMYPWSNASITVLPLLGLNILESLDFTPQSA